MIRLKDKHNARLEQAMNKYRDRILETIGALKYAQYKICKGDLEGSFDTMSRAIMDLGEITGCQTPLCRDYHDTCWGMDAEAQNRPPCKIIQFPGGRCHE